MQSSYTYQQTLSARLFKLLERLYFYLGFLVRYSVNPIEFYLWIVFSVLLVNRF